MNIRISSLLRFPLLSILFSLPLVSCSLDENPRDQIAEEIAYSSAKQLYLNTVATLYKVLPFFELVG